MGVYRVSPPRRKERKKIDAIGVTTDILIDKQIPYPNDSSSVRFHLVFLAPQSAAEAQGKAYPEYGMSCL